MRNAILLDMDSRQLAGEMGGNGPKDQVGIQKAFSTLPGRFYIPPQSLSFSTAP